MTAKDKPTEAELDKELERYLDELLTKLSVVAGVAKERGKPQLMYALNRAWHEVYNGRQL
jgi:hypothetical protein